MYRYFIALLLIPSLYSIDVQEFKESFQLGYLTTEQGHEKAEGLSDIMKHDLDQGLAILHAIDQVILPGYDYFVEHYLDEMKTCKGRLILVGAGSSGRIAIDLSAKSGRDDVLAVVAGGDRTFVRARESFEDSIEHGKEAGRRHGLCSDDTVILISSSGSASFNVGMGQLAHEVGAKCYYFYNSKRVPARTQSLFDDYGAWPVLVDIGPPAIRGSTRLQSGTVGLLCLGTLILNEDPQAVRLGLEKANAEIRMRMPEIKALIEKEVAVLAHPDANFYKLSDQTDRGYITFIADSDALREIMIDTSETAPTFSTNLPRTVNEVGLKQAEFQAFLCDHNNAWEKMLGRPVFEEDIALTEELLLNAEGFSRRHTGEGNLVIAVYKKEKSEQLQELIDSTPGVCELSFSAESPLVETIALKQILNMISNSTMILMNKVDGNYMIDMKAANHKLTDRCIRLTQESFKRRGLALEKSYDELFNMIQEIGVIKGEYEVDRGEYTPSPMKIAVTMLRKGCDAHEAISYLREVREDLSAVFSNRGEVIYLDGGGTKIDLYQVSSEGNISFSTADGGGNLNVRSREQVEETLANLLEGVSRDVKVVGGFAGAGSPQNSQALEDILHNMGFESVSITHDIGLILNLVKGDVVVLIAGSGSSCFARKGGEIRSFGGLGPLIGDEGSGYWLGRHAINCALQYEQGWGTPTTLLERLKELYQVETLKEVVYPLHHGETHFPLAAQIVLQERDDAVAQQLIRQGAGELRKSLDAALEWSGAKRVVLQGGLFNSPEYTASIVQGSDFQVTNLGISSLERLMEN